MLTRMLDRPGPGPADCGDARMDFPVPPGTAARRLGTGIRTAGGGQDPRAGACLPVGHAPRGLMAWSVNWDRFGGRGFQRTVDGCFG
ncbi:hypothetical protein GCM10020295_22310 [Streptomyces cinereospinus]